MSGNFSISNNLTVGGSVSCTSFSASTATIPTLTVNNLNVSGTNNTGGFQTLTSTDISTKNVVATGQITSPSILVGTKNVGTSLSTLQSDMTSSQTAINALTTKTTNQVYIAATQTTTISGTLEATKFTLNGTDVNALTGAIPDLQSRTANQSTGGTTTTTFAGPVTSTGLITANGGLTIPSTKTLTIAGDINANSVTVTPVQLSYVTGATSNIQSQLTTLQTKTANQSTSGTTTTFSGPVTTAGLITANAGLTVPVSKTLTMLGDLTANSTIVTPVQLSYLNGATTNIQGQLNVVNGKTANQNTSGTTTTFAGPITSTGLITANSGLTTPSTKVLTIAGDINANSVTITPAQLSYLNGATSNIQGQLNNLTDKTANQTASGSTTTFAGTLATTSLSLNGTDLTTRLAEIAAGPSQLLASQNTWTDKNTFNRTIITGRNNTIDGPQGVIDSTVGLHLQSNRTAADGMSYIMNNKGTAIGNGGFRMQRYDGNGTFIDEPITVADTINVNKPTTINGALFCSNNITTVNASVVCKGIKSDAIRTLNEYGNVTCTLLDAETMDGVPSSIKTYSSTASAIATVTVPKNGSYRCSISCPVGFRGKQSGLVADILYTRQLVTSNIKYMVVNKLSNTVMSVGSNITLSDDRATVARAYTIKAPSGEYKQYITNVAFSADLPYDPDNDLQYDIYLDLGQKDVTINYKSTLTYFVNILSTSTSGTTASLLSFSSTTRASGSAISGTSVECNEVYAQTATIANATIPNLFSPLVGNIAGFVRGSYGFEPIICTIIDTNKFYGAGAGITNSDGAYIIFPRFKLILYEDPGFGREYTVTYSGMANLNLDNTYGTQPMLKFVTLPSGSGVGSIRVFYNNVEVNIPLSGFTT